MSAANQLIMAISRGDEKGFVSSLRAGNLLQGLQNEQAINQFCQRVPPDLSKIIAASLTSRLYFQQGRFEDALKKQCEVLPIKVVNERYEKSFYARVFQSCIIQARICAEHADKELAENFEKPVHMEALANNLRRYYTEVIRIFPDHLLYILNNQIRLFFKVDNHEMCEHTFRNIAQGNYKDGIDHLPHSQIVVYYYYLGYLNFLNMKLDEAEKHLSKALRLCPLKYKKNRRIILNMLIPLWILKQKYVSKTFLRENNLDIFVDLISSVKSGNVSRFSETVEKHEEYFMRTGILLVVHSAKKIAVLNFLKRGYDIMKSIPGYLAKPVQVHVSSYFEALKKHIPDLDHDELECYVANLIAEKYILGCIDARYNILVLAPNNAFPLPK